MYKQWLASSARSILEHPPAILSSIHSTKLSHTRKAIHIMHFNFQTLSLSLISAFLLCNDFVTATPQRRPTKKTTTITAEATSTTAIATPTPKPLHGCRVFVQRWGLDSWETFDTMQYVSPLTPIPYLVTNFPVPPTNQIPNSESDGKEIFNQATIGSTTPGDELVPYQFGSNILHIYNTANPVYVGLPAGTMDPGKLSFVWGSQKWDNFSPGNPCLNKASNAGLNSSCTFQCDRQWGDRALWAVRLFHSRKLE